MIIKLNCVVFLECADDLLVISSLVIFVLFRFWRGGHVICREIIVFLITLRCHKDVNHLLRACPHLVCATQGLTLLHSVLRLTFKEFVIDVSFIELKDHVAVKWYRVTTVFILFIALRLLYYELEHFAHFISRETKERKKIRISQFNSSLIYESPQQTY